MTQTLTRRMTTPGLVTLATLVLSVTPAGAVTLQVGAGGDLQRAIDLAMPGDEIVLEAGARFQGNFVLRPKPAGEPITIRSSAVVPDRRITPADAPLLPTIVSRNGAPAITGHGARGWTFRGVRFEANVGGANNVIELLDAARITLDRILLIAPSTGQRRAVLGNGTAITLTRSHIAGIWAPTLQDSQCFLAYDGAGPYTITDNFCEAASENVMFGGPPSASPASIPADILVQGNHFTKQLSWKGTRKAVKNLFELKTAKRVVVRGNLFERNWTDAQAGVAILFTVRDDTGRAPWSVIEDVLFERNIIRDTEGVFNLHGYDDVQSSGRTTRITIRHNLAIGSGTFLMAGGELGTVTVDHNTVDQRGTFMMLYKGNVWPAPGARRPGRFAVESLTVTNNLANHGTYGVFGDGGFIGTSALNGMAPGFVWTHNVLAGGDSARYSYPAITWKPAAAEHAAQFNSDYSLKPESAYRGSASDGQSLGWQGAMVQGIDPPRTDRCPWRRCR